MDDRKKTYGGWRFQFYCWWTIIFLYVAAFVYFITGCGRRAGSMVLLFPLALMCVGVPIVSALPGWYRDIARAKHRAALLIWKELHGIGNSEESAVGDGYNLEGRECPSCGHRIEEGEVGVSSIVVVACCQPTRSETDRKRDDADDRKHFN